MHLLAEGSATFSGTITTTSSHFFLKLHLTTLPKSHVRASDFAKRRTNLIEKTNTYILVLS